MRTKLEYLRYIAKYVTAGQVKKSEIILKRFLHFLRFKIFLLANIFFFQTQVCLATRRLAQECNITMMEPPPQRKPKGSTVMKYFKRYTIMHAIIAFLFTCIELAALTVLSVIVEN